MFGTAALEALLAHRGRGMDYTHALGASFMWPWSPCGLLCAIHDQGGVPIVHGRHAAAVR